MTYFCLHTDNNRLLSAKKELLVHIKNRICRKCGAPKITEPKTAYVYCDFCGLYMEWDYHTAISTPGSRMPGPEYEALNRELAPRLEEAWNKGDREAYKKLQAELFSLYVESCPAALSPRIGDPSYRKKLIDYMAEQHTLMAFERDLRKLSDTVNRAMKKIKWKRDREGNARVESKSFWRLFEVTHANTVAVTRKCEETGLLQLYPEHFTGEQSVQMAVAMMVEGWFTYLEDKDLEKLLTITGLKREYVDVPDREFMERKCGSCGLDLPVVAGAERVVCESCGRVIDASAGVIPCGQCGADLSVPAGHRSFQCPMCNNSIRLKG